ncbi:MAG: response regulator [Elainellaceae cyanobacterium]
MIYKRVLIIEDEEAIQTVVKFGLKLSVGWDTIAALSGPEGIKHAQTEQPDIILLDVMMPDMDGLTTFQHLRQKPETRSIPVILLTAKAQASEKRVFQKMGVNGVITKPFNSLELAEEIAQILNW